MNKIFKLLILLMHPIKAYRQYKCTQRKKEVVRILKNKADKVLEAKIEKFQKYNITLPEWRDSYEKTCQNVS